MCSILSTLSVFLPEELGVIWKNESMKKHRARDQNMEIRLSEMNRRIFLNNVLIGSCGLFVVVRLSAEDGHRPV